MIRKLPQGYLTEVVVLECPECDNEERILARGGRWKTFGWLREDKRGDVLVDVWVCEKCGTEFYTECD